jgi:DSF synthase
MLEVHRIGKANSAGLGLNCSHLLLSYDPELEIIWARFASRTRPFFSVELLDEMDACLRALTRNPTWRHEREELPVRYVVIGSASEGRFSLGGDLAFFRDCILRGDWNQLREYGRKCVDVLYRWSTTLGEAVTTIALVEGKALGGGFECALGCHYLIADEAAVFGFPEALFNMFPGMGGYSFLVRKIGVTLTEALILKGNQFSAQRLQELGVLEMVAPSGKGSDAVEVFVRTHRARFRTRRAVERLRGMVAPVSYEELMSIVELWIESAARLSERDLRRLNMLIEAQTAELAREETPRLRAV